jgi:hypothetical protein
LPLHDGDVNTPYDVDVEIMELPYLCRTTVDTIPAVIPYLHVPPRPIIREGGPAIGLAWRTSDWSPERSMPFAALAPLLVAPATWYILQIGQPLAECPPGFGILPNTEALLDTARLVSALDLVITVDAMPAHLAGALGTPVWTMLAADANWRWMRGRDDSPWYPTMRLFRQDQPGEWGAVIGRVARALTSALAQGTIDRRRSAVPLLSVGNEPSHVPVRQAAALRR